MSYHNFFRKQHFIGKIIGAFCGFFIGGPLLAIIGIFIGHIFDRRIFKYVNHPSWIDSLKAEPQLQERYYYLIFAVMGYVAKADGRVSEQEILAAKNSMRYLNLNRLEERLAKYSFNQGKSSDFSLEGALQELLIISYSRPRLLEIFIDLQYHSAYEIQDLSAKKIEVLNQIFMYLGFAPLQKQQSFYEAYFYRQQKYYQQQQEQQQNHKNNNYNYTKAATKSNLEEACSILGINYSTELTKKELAKVYRRLMSQYHPDKLISQGASAAMIKTATQKTQAIRQAYEEICTSKGWAKHSSQ